MSIAGSSSIRRLEDVAVVMDLDELAPVGGWATSGRHRWWLERFAEMREDFPDRPRPQQPEVAKSAKARDGFALGKQSERDQPDVAAARWALAGKLLPHPSHELGLLRREVSCELGF